MKKFINIMMLSFFLSLGAYPILHAQENPKKEAQKAPKSSEDKKKSQVCERCKKNTVKNIIECVPISCDDI
ncbi:MAG: hypothetical protein H7A32_02125 [Deltaproteobacteria bacterium]|nr:hypothetical protein [Deltaproteobacteria bacterium]